MWPQSGALKRNYGLKENRVMEKKNAPDGAEQESKLSR